MKKIRSRLLIAVIFIISGIIGNSVYCEPSVQASDVRQTKFLSAFGGPDLDVPYVPTPEEVVAKMLDMAQVNDKDLVYDLGCGDGRIVIMAAQKKGARGIGFDLDPERIYECKQNAKIAGVNDRVQFKQQDLFTTDLSEATVVTMYLLQSVNLQMRPRLFAQLRPGTRVVSHDFDMGEWEPDQSAELDGHNVYYWVIPANASGTWEWNMPSRSGGKHCALKINQKYQKASGTLSAGKSQTPIRDVKITGDALSFTADRMVNGRMTPMTYKGRMNGNTIRGSIRGADGSAAEATNWKAQRKPNTIVAIYDK